MLSSYLIWAVLLLISGLAIAALELFIPSAGLLGLVAAGAVVAALVMAFLDGPMTFIIFSVVTVIVLPLGVTIALKSWPHTPIGRRLMLAAPSSDEVLPASNSRNELHDLIGEVVEAKCDMLPGGAIEYNGRTIDALSEGMAIDAGQQVVVLRVDGNFLVVRPVEENETLENDDDLSKPIDSLGIDPDSNLFE